MNEEVKNSESKKIELGRSFPSGMQCYLVKTATLDTFDAEFNGLSSPTNTSQSAIKGPSGIALQPTPVTVVPAQLDAANTINTQSESESK